jgi:hypothetical protein
MVRRRRRYAAKVEQMVARRAAALAALREGHGLQAAPELLLPRGVLRGQPQAMHGQAASSECP